MNTVSQRSDYLSAIGVPVWYARHSLPGAAESSWDEFPHFGANSAGAPRSESVSVAAPGLETRSPVEVLASSSIDLPQKVPARAKISLAAELSLTAAKQRAGDELPQTEQVVAPNQLRGVQLDAALPSVFVLKAYLNNGVALVSLSQSLQTDARAESILAANLFAALLSSTAQDPHLIASFSWPALAAVDVTPINDDSLQRKLVARFISDLDVYDISSVICLGFDLNAFGGESHVRGARLTSVADVSLEKCLQSPQAKRELWRQVVEVGFVISKRA